MDTPCLLAGLQLCRLCLSSARSLSSVDSVRWAFEVLAGTTESQKTTAASTKVCWECRATLLRFQRFKKQAHQAQLLLDASPGCTVSPACLSQLAVTNKTSYDVECVSAFQTEDILNGFGDLETKIFDPKIELDIGEDDITNLDVWADPVEFDDAKVEEECSLGDIPCIKSIEKNIDDDQFDNVAPKTDVDVSVVVKSRKPFGKILKRKTKKIKRVLEKNNSHEKFKRGKHFKINVRKKVREFNATESCETCGGVRKRTKSTVASVAESSAKVDSPYKCGICNVAFKFEKSLFRHNKDKHSGGDHIVVCSCMEPRPQLRRGDKSNPKVKLPTRNSETGTFDCDVCGAKLKSDEYFRLHYEAHVSEKSFECATCGNLYKTRAQMFKHLIVHKPHRYLCHICGKSKLSMGSLNIHFLSHSGLEERPHKCTVCSRTFITRDKLKIHSRFHDGVKPFKCTLCSSAFYVNFELTKHMKTNHSIGETEERVKKDKIKRTISQCRNARMKQDEKPEDTQNGEKRDGKSSKRKNDLTCDICGKMFAQKVCLDAHVVVHTGDRPFKCEECGQTFKFQSNVLTHAKSVHMVDKIHQCSICGARFKLKGNLTAHFKIHSGEKPFSCDICDQKFIRSRNLRNHYKVHAK